LERRGASRTGIESSQDALDPEALTLGFARRFATYKRATLLFKHLDRLEALLTNKDRPVQLVFAGKAHPQDKKGKEFIKEIVSAAKEPPLPSPDYLYRGLRHQRRPLHGPRRGRMAQHAPAPPGSLGH
jgi:glucan phosphorylase